MLRLAFITTLFTAVFTFNITHLIVPATVSPEQETVDIECGYEGNFTVLMWFKDRKEFFRYKPGAAPSTTSFPIIGIGTVQLLYCGPVSCRLRLGALTELATGLYKCDIERDIRPYKFASSNAQMRVYGHVERKPLVEGLGQEFEEGDEIKAYCRATPGAEIRWYINGQEDQTMRGSPSLKVKSTRFLFIGLPPAVSVQCAEFKYGRLLGSKDVKGHWKLKDNCPESPQNQINRSNSLTISLILASVCSLYHFFKFLRVL